MLKVVSNYPGKERQPITAVTRNRWLGGNRKYFFLYSFKLSGENPEANPRLRVAASRYVQFYIKTGNISLTINYKNQSL